MSNIMDIIAKETNGKSYKTFKYTYEGSDVLSFAYDDHQEITWERYGETVPPNGSINLKRKADSIANDKPLFGFFLDGSRHTYKVDDIAYSTIYRDSHRKEIEGIRKAIDKTGREIVLSLSPGPARLQDGSFLQKNANMWRLTDDFWDEWELLYDMFDRCNYWSPFIRKGNWPDCDMLPLGHIGIRSGERGKADRMTCFTKPEQKTMITLWSIFQSPLMYGGELADLDAWTLSLLTNTEVNEMHRTLEGQRQEYRDDEWIVWSGENKESTYIAIFNVSDEKKEIPGKLTERYLRKDAKEIWSGKKVTEGTEEVENHGCVLYQMKRI